MNLWYLLGALVCAAVAVTSVTYLLVKYSELLDELDKQHKEGGGE